jgi:hypothetical protein
MIDTDDLPRTQNEGWGFYGTMKDYAEAAWPLALLAIRAATEESLEDVRAFLDSRSGRHFADEVHNGLHRGESLQESIDGATRLWMEWKVGDRLSRLYRLPKGMAYLLAMVVHEGIQSDLEER